MYYFTIKIKLVQNITNTICILPKRFQLQTLVLIKLKVINVLKQLLETAHKCN